MAENGRWQTHPLNFENIGQGLLTLYALSTFDGWSKVLSIAINSDVKEMVMFNIPRRYD
jgi:hypothetical protein